MKQSWALNIEDFGKIKAAKIEVAPFLLFVGENNSGKSYVVSLLWGLLTLGRFLFPQDVPNTESYKKLERAIFKNLSFESFDLTPDINDKIIGWFNLVLKSKKSELVKQIFSNTDLTIGRLFLSDYKRSAILKINWQSKDNEVAQRISSGKDYIRIPIDKANVTDIEKYKIIQYIVWKVVVEDLSSPLYPMNIAISRRAGGESLYLPAARTGFMLTYKSLTSELMNIWATDEAVQNRFTLPVVRFLQGLIDAKHSDKAKYAIIADFLEEKILHGKIEHKDNPIPDYSYIPQNTKSSLPFHITSSLVTELSPLIIFLRSNIDYKSLIIEEPEAHLHPKMQRIMVQAMAQLVNKGLPLWCTTHSDTILQQVNNFIKLHNHSKRKEFLQKFNYIENNLIDPNNIKAYQFRVEKHTIVSPLKLTKDGFEVPTFNESIIDLAKETIELRDGD